MSGHPRTPEIFDKLTEREYAQADTRKTRVDRLWAKVLEFFPGEEARELRENIKRSFLVPQAGEYHNEGMFMDSHLDVIGKAIDAVERGEFPPEISEQVRVWLARAVTRDIDAVRRYVFLHDIAKTDCMTIKFVDGGRAVSWQEWTEMLLEDEDGRGAMQGNEAALSRYIKKKGIKGVSYYQQGETNRQHGDVGAQELRAAGVVDDPKLLAAIETHEAAYQFANKEEDQNHVVNVYAERYGRIFSEMSEEARDFALLASFVDTMASWRTDGQPNLTSFLALAASREKWESLRELSGRLKGGEGLDRGRFQKAWTSLANSKEPLPLTAVDETEARLRAEARTASYDTEKLRANLAPLVERGDMTAEEVEQLVALVRDSPQTIGRTFGKKMRVLKPILDQALI